jgi:urease accessory protein UreF
MNLIGPIEGGRLTHDLCLAVEKLVAENLANRFEENNTGSGNGELDVEFAHQVCPLIEILSNAHDRLYTRLFNS